MPTTSAARAPLNPLSSPLLMWSSFAGPGPPLRPHLAPLRSRNGVERTTTVKLRACDRGRQGNRRSRETSMVDRTRWPGRLVRWQSRGPASGGEVVGVHVVDELPELLDHAVLGVLAALRRLGVV